MMLSDGADCQLWTSSQMLDGSCGCDDTVLILPWRQRFQLRHLLVRFSKASGILPASMFLKGVECGIRDTVAGGGFADIYRATYQGQEVALKKLRSVRSGEKGAHMYTAVSVSRPPMWCTALMLSAADVMSRSPALVAVAPS